MYNKKTPYFITYLKSSQASANAGKEPPSLNGAIYRVTVTVRKFGIMIILKKRVKDIHFEFD